MNRRKPNNALKARHIVLAGASDMGKSSVIKSVLREEKPERVVVWDYKNEYGELGFREVLSLPALAKHLMTAKTGRFAFYGKADQFPDFCKVVWGWGACLAIFEEMGSTSRSSGKALDELGDIYRAGRAYGIQTIATTQSTGEIPSTIRDNMSEVYAFALTRKGQRKTVAEDLGINPEHLPKVPLEFVHWIRKGDQLLRGNVEYKRNIPRIQEETLSI